MGIKLTILGYNAAIPTAKANPTAQLLNINESCYLIDCGEGTQIQLRKAKIKLSKINTIFISHMHGDHLFGLIGLISTLELLGRENPLHIYGPKGIKQFITFQQEATSSYNKLKLVFHELESKQSEKIYEDKKVEVFTIPLIHRMYTNGFLFKEKLKSRRLNIDTINKYPEIEICDYENLKNGRDFALSNGEVIKNEVLTHDPEKTISYAFCSDTAYNEKVIPIINEVNLLYHEATFKEDKIKLAKQTGHSTASQAAEIAKKANVKKLVLGHFSNRYKDPKEVYEEAKAIFENTIWLNQLEELDIE